MVFTCCHSFSLVVPLVGTYRHSLSLDFTRFTTHLSFHKRSHIIVIHYIKSWIKTFTNQIGFLFHFKNQNQALLLALIHFHLLSLVVPLVVTCCHSLSLAITRCVTGLSSYKQSFSIQVFISYLKDSCRQNLSKYNCDIMFPESVTIPLLIFLFENFIVLEKRLRHNFFVLI